MANGVIDFDYTPQRDSVQKIKFLGREKATHLRVYLTVNGQKHVSDINLSDGVATYKPYER